LKLARAATYTPWVCGYCWLAVSVERPVLPMYLTVALPLPAAVP
jgi:hypothetical protein